MALTEHFGGAADALQRNIVVAPRVAQTELAETYVTRLLVVLSLMVICVPFPCKIAELICEF